MCECETPKSPPGDYNFHPRTRRSPRSRCPRVKHLNPRQGITTFTLELDVLRVHDVLV